MASVVFYTQPKTQGAMASHRNIAPHQQGNADVDVVDNVITFVEVLYRNDIREKLLAVLP